MEVEVNVIAENPITGEQKHTNSAYLVYVAIDEKGTPTEIPPLFSETTEEKERMERAKERQTTRLKQMKEEKKS